MADLVLIYSGFFKLICYSEDHHTIATRLSIFWPMKRSTAINLIAKWLEVGWLVSIDHHIGVDLKIRLV